jgi:mannan endo-1,6-alpha-mannosidase
MAIQRRADTCRHYGNTSGSGLRTQPSKWTRLTSLALSLSLLSTTTTALELTPGDKDSVCDAATLVTNGIMDYYEGTRYGGTPGMFQPPYYWWEAGEGLGGMIDTWAWCKNDTYQTIIYDALMHQKGPNNDYVPSNQSTTEGNDDQAFWGLAVMEATERNFTNPPDDEPGWLALSQAVYNTMWSRWDNQACGGGLRWQIFQWNSGYGYKNTISNSCLFTMAARLARYTQNDTYVDTAETVWDWLVSVQFIQDSTNGYSIYDGANIGNNNCTTIHKETWSYNYGLLLAGTAYLYNFTNDEKWLTRFQDVYTGIEDTFVNQSTGIIYERMCQQSGNCNNDQRSFKSIFSRCLGQSARLVSSYTDKIMDLINKSAQGAASSCSGGSDGHTCGINWSYGSWDGWYGLGEQISALEIMQNTLVMVVPPPLTNSTGGTSQGDANAGLTQRETTNKNQITVTQKDKAGAGVLTAIVLIIFVGISGWIVI